ncbi:hypothetical protein CHS0354_041619 [Potamilus streckersoni]|uniref:Guanylate cyclase domain-containing protein n=1 Tax=Potamilus streckersoni TaxID=2493646 RepID=A0AAE0VWB7_9BIVA|nr:hypothetical protein CHS0354_041619 [Potamilus streckersoni]
MNTHTTGNTVIQQQHAHANDAMDEESMSKLKKMKPHVPGIIIFADHSRPLPWTVTYHACVIFADVSGFTALCEKYSTMQQAGIDQLTRTLNEYLSALVDEILGSDGDILKFAGDAILAIWRVGQMEELPSTVDKVIKCCIDIQTKCGEWNTDIGVKLTVKLGVSAGEMSITYLGNDEYRHYVELGPAVTDVNVAENLCHSGYVVLSQGAWKLCNQPMYNIETLEDGIHVRILGLKVIKQQLNEATSDAIRRYSASAASSTDKNPKGLHGPLVYVTPAPPERSNKQFSLFSAGEEIFNILPNEVTPFNNSITEGRINLEGSTIDPPQVKISPDVKETTVGLGSKNLAKFGKLKKVVQTVTGMRLDLALRLYILPPVMKKLDDGQPLQYLSEMRQVSIVFMNLVLNEGQDVTKLLQRIFEIVYSNVTSMQGCLNKLFLFDKGCTYLVIFGLPGYKHDQDCAHALICSGRMKKTLDKVPGVLRVSIGVTTGTTFCGVVGHPQRHEYSVIGRKVNMAARLMMHYPDKVTCDDSIFQASRLPLTNFDILITKQMKGLRDVGVIREFIEHFEQAARIPKSIPNFLYPILGREHEIKIFQAKLKKLEEEENKKEHLILSGAAGVGKTRLLNHLINLASKQNFIVISCRPDLEDAAFPDLLASHIMRTLLTNAGFSNHVGQEPAILEALGQEKSYLYVLNDFLGTNENMPPSASKVEFSHVEKKKELLQKLVELSLTHSRATVIVIDDAHNTDQSSWTFMNQLISINKIFLLMSVRPSMVDRPPCPEAFKIIDNTNVNIHEMGNLHLKYIAPLACQLLDVVCIPKDLEKILHERSLGVPTWCLELLRDMLNKSVLQVIEDDGTPGLRDATVTPNRAYITPSLIVSGTEAISSVLRVSATKLNKDASQEGESMQFLADLGYLPESPYVPGSKKRTSVIEKPDRIVVFNKKVNPHDLPVPDIMKELVISRLDSMQSADQLVVKCASVLGMSVPLDVLESLLPKALKHKVQMIAKRLLENKIFLCGTPVDTTRYISPAKKAKEKQSVKYECHCITDKPVCQMPCFVNKLHQQAAYEILLDNQRVELHAKAATYYELMADKLRNNIPYYLLARSPPYFLQEAVDKHQELMSSGSRHQKGKRKRTENIPADDKYDDDAIEHRNRRGRRDALTIYNEDAFPMVRSILLGAKPMQSVGHYIQQLQPLYDKMVYHWEMAKKPWMVIDTRLEATAAAITTKNYRQALLIIQETEKMLAQRTETEEEPDRQIEVYQAKLLRLRGKARYLIGDPNGYTLITHAASILGLKQPKTPHKMRMHLMKLRLEFTLTWKIQMDRNIVSSMRMLEQGYCLSDLYSMDKDQKDIRFTHALQQFTLLTGQAVHLHQFITAYVALIECFRERGNISQSGHLEVELLEKCAKRHEELSSEDRSILAKVYAESCVMSLQKGELEKAEVIGQTAAEIIATIHDWSAGSQYTPYFGFVSIMRNKFESCVDSLRQLRRSAQLADNRNAKAWYHTLCMELMLLGENPVESVQNCIAFATTYLKQCDCMANEMSTRYYLAMTIALWYARKEKWESTQLWFDYWEIFETDECSFYSLGARARKIEVMLHSLSKAVEIGNKPVVRQLKAVLTGEFLLLSTNLKQVPCLLPRCYHLKAYFLLLKGYKFLARIILSKALSIAEKQGNLQEKHWISNNKAKWFVDQFTDNSKWNELTETHILDWKLYLGRRHGNTIYTPPLPVKA